MCNLQEADALIEALSLSLKIRSLDELWLIMIIAFLNVSFNESIFSYLLFLNPHTTLEKSRKFTDQHKSRQNFTRRERKLFTHNEKGDEPTCFPAFKQNSFSIFFFTSLNTAKCWSGVCGADENYVPIWIEYFLYFQSLVKSIKLLISTADVCWFFKSQIHC